MSTDERPMDIVASKEKPWPRLQGVFEQLWPIVEKYTDGEIGDLEFAARVESVFRAPSAGGEPSAPEPIYVVDAMIEAHRMMEEDGHPGPTIHDAVASLKAKARAGASPGGDIVYESDERHGASCSCPRCIPDDEPIAGASPGGDVEEALNRRIENALQVVATREDLVEVDASLLLDIRAALRARREPSEEFEEIRISPAMLDFLRASQNRVGADGIKVRLARAASQEGE